MTRIPQKVFNAQLRVVERRFGKQAADGMSLGMRSWKVQGVLVVESWFDVPTSRGRFNPWHIVTRTMTGNVMRHTFKAIGL